MIYIALFKYQGLESNRNSRTSGLRGSNGRQHNPLTKSFALLDYTVGFGCTYAVDSTDQPMSNWGLIKKVSDTEV